MSFVRWMNQDLSLPGLIRRARGNCEMAQITGPKAIDDKEYSRTTFAKEWSYKMIWKGWKGVGGLREAASFTYLFFFAQPPYFPFLF